MDELTLEALAKRIEAIEKQLAEQEESSPDQERSVGTFGDDPQPMRPVIVESTSSANHVTRE